MTNEALVLSYIKGDKSTGKSSSMLFLGRALYSYGTHWRICEINRELSTITYLNKDKRSTTTSKHTSLATRLLTSKGYNVNA